MKIVNLINDPIKACATFEYRGYTISFSTIMKNSSVLIYTGSGKDYLEETFDTVEQAIDFINENKA